MERRNFTRVEFSGYASIRYDDNVVWGDVDNLSLQGLYIETSHDFPVDMPLEVTIHQSQISPINLNASAVHYEKSGTGMKINDVDVMSFVRLRDEVSLKCKDLRLVMNETYKVLHCIH